MKYVTYLVTYSGDKLPKFYIGSTSAGQNHPKYVDTLSEETKSKISKALTGRIEPEDTRKKKSESKLGKKIVFMVRSTQTTQKTKFPKLKKEQNLGIREFLCKKKQK